MEFSYFKCFLIYYNSGRLSKASRGKLVAHLWMDTMTSHVRNANPSRADDHHNGRFSIPIAHCICLPRPYPSRGNDVCGSKRLLRGPCFWRSRCGKREAICSAPSVRHYGVVGGEYWQPINHSVRTDLLGNPLLLRGISLLRRFSSNKSSSLFVFLLVSECRSKCADRFMRKHNSLSKRLSRYSQSRGNHESSMPYSSQFLLFTAILRFEFATNNWTNYELVIY